MAKSFWGTRARLLLAVALVAAVPVTGVLPAGAAEARHGYEEVLRITFPLKDYQSYAETYHAPRSGGRVHQATDIMAKKGQRIFAVKSGVVCYITGVGEPMPSWGYMIKICGNDGMRYSYLHINNDDPGTDNGKGGVVNAYSNKVREGATVRRGQFLGWVGDSGNAETTAPHLHFEIEDPNLDDARIQKESYDPLRMNPYYSLRRAERRGDLPGVHFPRA